MNKLHHLETTFYQYVPNGGILDIDEQEADGYMHVKVTVQGEAVKFSIKPNQGFAYLKVKKTSDHIVFIKQNDSWHVQIFECKRTVKEKTWSSVKKQFAGGILHAHMLKGLLDIGEIATITVYTVYKYDQMLKNTTDPITLRQPVGTSISKKEFADWDHECVKVMDEYDPLPHKRIQVDEDGFGEWEI